MPVRWSRPHHAVKSPINAAKGVRCRGVHGEPLKKGEAIMGQAKIAVSAVLPLR